MKYGEYVASHTKREVRYDVFQTKKLLDAPLSLGLG